MESKHILTVEEFKELARPISKHVDEDEVKAFIRECEDMNIISAVGLETFEALTEDELDEAHDILLNGGTWTVSVCGCEKDRKMKCAGLKTALSYFVYAKMIQSDGGIITRTGMMRHNDEHASHTDDKNRVRRYNDVMNVAEEYLSGCLMYWKSVKGEEVRPVRGSRVHIHAVGD